MQLFLARNRTACGSRDILCGQPDGFAQILHFAHFTEPVAEADALHRAGGVLDEAFGHRAAKAVEDAGVFRGDGAARARGAGQHQLLVKRLDGVDVDDFGGNPLGLQQLCGIERFCDHDAAGKNRNVAARLQQVAFAERERGAFVENRSSRR